MINIFEYVHTSGRKTDKIQSDFIKQHTNNILISLIHGLRQSNSGFETIKKSATRDIKEYQEELGNDSKLFVDSGGYSILSGEIPFSKIRHSIECYNWVLENIMSEYGDYIFSLDIPIFLKEPQYNTASLIKEVNQKSLEQSLDILNNNTNLYDKFIFVWQFKSKIQYAVWCELYHEFFRDNQNLKHFAIGGMVGLRGIVDIKFSPFITLAFKCAHELFKKNDHDETSLIHILGVYHLHDRFAMAFLHKLFNELYFSACHRNIQITYDTVNYMLSGLYNVRELNMMMFDENQITHMRADDLIKQVDKMSSESHIQDVIKEDLELLQNGKPLNNPAMTSLINIVHNINIDKIFNHVIDEYNIIEIFLNNCQRHTTLRPQLLPLLLDLERKYPQAFKKRTYKNLENFEWMRQLHVWWMKGCNKDLLEQKIYQFIKAINFPVDLREM